MNRLENCVLKTSLLPPGRLTVTVNGTGVDVSELQDMVKLILMAESVSGASRTLDIEITDGLTLAGAYASLVPPINFVQVTTADSEQELDINIERARNFIRAEVTITGTTPIYETSLSMVGRTGQE
jgi:hypothetical protein